MGAHGQYPITLVTAYFELGGKQRHPGNPFPGWIRNLLPFVEWPMVIFCDEQSLDMLKEARADKPAVWHVTRMDEFFAYKHWGFLKQLEPAMGFAAEHSLIWHEKCNFVRRAMLENPFGSEMFFWCDAGLSKVVHGLPWWSIRRMQFRLFEGVEWPNLRVCRALPKDKVLLLKYGSSPPILGGYFGGQSEAVHRWCDVYYQHLETRIRDGLITSTYYEEQVMYSLSVRRPNLAYILPHCPARWIWLVGFLIRAAGIRHAGGKVNLSFYKWYLLSGGRFPWKYFYRRVFSRPV